MIEILVNALNVKTMTMVLAAIAAAATILTIAMPYAFSDSLGQRMKAVAIEREKIRARERERIAQQSQKVNLRQSPKQSIKAIVERFNLTKWVGQEEARLKLVQAGYRGQAPYVTYLFFRMVTPVASFVLTAFYLFVVLDLTHHQWRSICSTVGVSSLVMQGDRPHPVPNGVVETLVASSDALGLLQLRQQLRVGGSVRLAAGPFAERLAILQHLDDSGRIRVLLDILGRQVLVSTGYGSVLPV